MTSQSDLKIYCALCSLEMASPQVIDGDKKFCCPGCRAVYNILSVKNQLDGFKDHPLFRQALSSGLISNPELLRELEKGRVEVPEEEKTKLYLEVGDLWCPSCAEIIKWMVMKEKGVLNVVVDYSTDLASIEFAPRYISGETIVSIIASLGYNPCPLGDGVGRKISFSLWLRFGVAAFCSLNVMMLSYPLYATYFDPQGGDWGLILAWASLLLSLPVVFYSAWPIWRRLVNALSVGVVGMELLVFLGVSASFELSLSSLLQNQTVVYFDAMTVIITFVLLGKMIESKAKYTAKEALVLLARSLPRRGKKRFSDGREEYVPAKEFSKGDLCSVNSGERIVLDGVVVEGEAGVDDSVMTGESIPKLKKAGDSLLGGSVVQSGRLLFKISATCDETAMQKILETVEQQMGQKHEYVRAADRVAVYFIPLVILLSLGVYFSGYPLRAIAVLLISCPCALGIAAPLAEAYAMGALFSLGAIVRNRGALAFLGKETVCVFDKTGTLTEGRFRLLDGLATLTPSQKGVLKGLTLCSNHPLSRTIAASIEQEGDHVGKVIEYAGLGLECHRALLGSFQFLKQKGIDVQENKSEETVVYFACDDLIFPLIFGDRVKSGAKEALISLYPARLILLSGDGEPVVSKVAKECGISEWASCCTPLEKREKIEALKQSGEIVWMVGDGINDAPALATAHVGISVMQAQDLSIQASDLLLTNDSLDGLSKISKVARFGRRIVKQNLFWAFFYNVLGVPLAILGYLSPIYSAFAMVASSLIVLFNARRVKK